MARLAVFDMDGTVLEEKSSWGRIHRHFNTTGVGRRGLELYTKGMIDYRQWMRMDISAWPKNVHISDLKEILKDYTIKEGAESTIRKLRQRGFKVAMISAGLDFLAEEVARELGMDAWVANGVNIDSRGRLTGEGVCRVDPLNKVVPFERILKRYRAERGDSIAVGDTRHDMSFLRAAGKGFLLGREEQDSDPAIIRIGKLSDIFLHL